MSKIDWVENINQVLGYIEHNLDGTIDYGTISKISVCPISLFQRLFVLSTGITLSEYIRRRRLTFAASELVKTDLRIIDIAIKYGYDSSDAFCFAFKRLFSITPSQIRRGDANWKPYRRIYFTLKVNYVKGDNDMILLNIDRYRYYGPLFEGVRIILSSMGEKYTPEYIQGISGAAFKIAGGCPSRPTCICDMWTSDFIRYLGYEVTEYPCYNKDGGDISDKMIEAVKRHIDSGKPALVWNAFTNAEWDVVCGYDEEAKQFIGRGTYKGNEDYCRESWDRAKTCDVAPTFGALLIGTRKTEFNERDAEINSLVNAVKHARKREENSSPSEGIEFYKNWVSEYSAEGKERGVADAYCYDVYSSVRKAAIVYLRTISYKYGGGILENMQMAATCFEKEANKLEEARPYLSWSSPWGIDEERSKNLAPILKEASVQYEKGVVYLEKALSCFNART